MPLTRSGKASSPYDDPARIATPQPRRIQTELNIAPLLADSIAREDARQEEDGDDCEGAKISSRPPSPPTEAPSAPTEAGQKKKKQPSPSSAAGVEKARSKAAAAERKRRSRVANARAAGSERNYRPRPAMRVRLGKPESITVGIDAQDLPASSGGAYVGKRQMRYRGKPWALEELKSMGLKVHPWDGREPRVLLDKEERAAVFLAGRPGDPGWDGVSSRSTEVLQRMRLQGVESGAFSSDDLDHRRGNFLAVASGVSFGGGQTRPGNLVHSKKRRKLIDEVLNHPDVIRIAGFQNSVLAYYAPKTFVFLRNTLRLLFRHHPGLQHNFKNSVFPAVTLNAGPDTTCLEHEDFGNAAGLHCVITSGGQYDPVKGGHLVIFCLGLIIEFPPGSTIGLPSATMSHGNTPIAEGETRTSITQYCAGGLLRWVAYGFRSAKSLASTKAGRDLKEKIDGPPGSRWRWALSLFSKASELQKDQAEAFSW